MDIFKPFYWNHHQHSTLLQKQPPLTTQGSKMMDQLMNKCIAFLLAVLIASGAFAQGDSTSKKRVLLLSPGISKQQQIFGELNLMYAREDLLKGGGPCLPGVAMDPRIGVEYNFSSSNRIIAPKIGYEISGLLLCLRANAVYYMGKHSNDLRFLPEVGLSLLGLLNITYGYGIKLTRQSLNEVSTSRITMTINCSKDLWEAL